MLSLLGLCRIELHLLLNIATAPNKLISSKVFSRTGQLSPRLQFVCLVSA